MLSIATSLDALAVGLSLAFLDVPIWTPSVVIGLVAGVLTLIGISFRQSDRPAAWTMGRSRWGGRAAGHRGATADVAYRMMTLTLPPIVGRRSRRCRLFLIPMLAFLGITWIGTQWPRIYPVTYAAKTVVVAVLLLVLWRHYTRIRWNHWWLGILVGILGILAVGADAAVAAVARRVFPPGRGVFNPTEYFSSPLALYGFFAVRIVGAVLLVPVMEELFWRDYVWRTIIAPNDFKLAAVGEWDWRAVRWSCR